MDPEQKLILLVHFSPEFLVGLTVRHCYRCVVHYLFREKSDADAALSWVACTSAVYESYRLGALFQELGDASPILSGDVDSVLILNTLLNLLYIKRRHENPDAQVASIRFSCDLEVPLFVLKPFLLKRKVRLMKILSFYRLLLFYLNVC